MLERGWGWQAWLLRNESRGAGESEDSCPYVGEKDFRFKTLQIRYLKGSWLSKRRKSPIRIHSGSLLDHVF